MTAGRGGRQAKGDGRQRATEGKREIFVPDMGTGRISAELELELVLELEQEEDMDYKISESEWLLMEQLWQGEMTQAQLAEHLGKKWNKNTIHTFLTRLCKKGFAEVDRERSPHVYRAAVPREACEKQERESFLQRVYRGNVGNMVAAFVKDNRLSAREAEALRKLLDEYGTKGTEPKYTADRQDLQ